MTDDEGTMQERTFDTGTVSLNFAEGPPNGPPLVLLPGYSRAWQSFLPVIPQFAEDWHVFALDYRGHGKSGHTPGEYRALDYFGDVTAFMMACVPEGAVLVGHSFGGGVALSIVATMPERIRALIIADMNLDLEAHLAVVDKPESADLIAMRRSLAGRPVEELLPVLKAQDTPPEEAEELSLLDPAVYDDLAAGCIKTWFAGIPWPDLQTITCPTLLIQGNPAMGGILTDREVAHALSVMPNVSHVRIDHAGHDLGFWKGNLTPFIGAMTGFLASL
jgi:pimeloyl-ACP methyl ester carboxylesterase